MLKVRLICTAIGWAILAPLVLVADAPDWPLGVVYAMLLAVIVLTLLLDERLTEREERKRTTKPGPDPIEIP